jgi:hypothetical protein
MDTWQSPYLAPVIARIFNCSFAQNSFPEAWKRANVCPVYKGKGSKIEPGSYHLISILSVLERIFEKAAAAELYVY